MPPLHDQKFVSGVQVPYGLRVRNIKKTYFKKLLIEDLMIKSKFLEGAPFKWASVFISYAANEFNKRRARINKTHEEMSLNFDLDKDVIKWADCESIPLFRDLHMIACLIPLLYVGEKYKLNTDLLQKQFNLYAPLPNTVEEAKDIVARGLVVHTDENIKEIESQFLDHEYFSSSL